MPKKTYYDKTPTPESLSNTLIEGGQTTPVENPTLQNVDISSHKEESSSKMRLNLKNNIVERVKPPPKPKRGRPEKQFKYDENGNKLKKDGTIDKRAETGMENLKKSRVYQQILENKKLKESVGKVAVLTPYAESEDSEDDVEFEIETEPEPVETKQADAKRSGTDDFIKKQEIEREKMLSDQLKAMELENKKLKDSFHYNSHLNRMQALSTNVKLKF